MDFKITLGIKIKELRKKLDLNQESFCDKLNIEFNRVNLSRIESGKQMPSAEFIKSILDSYDISPYWLFDIEEPIKEIDEYIEKYNNLNIKDKLTINTMIDHFTNTNNFKLSNSKGTEEREENKKSS